MKKITNKEKILTASVDLFNQSGIVAVTTNHIASHLGISPGNLYFHFRNKEEIIRQLFDDMCQTTYEVWAPVPTDLPHSSSPAELIERSYEVFWKYRFFHREMYHLRRKDPVLAQRWKRHLKKCVRLLQATYSRWVKDKVMARIEDPKEMQMINDVVLITSSTFLQFYESPEKPATRRSLKQGSHHILRFLLPYLTTQWREDTRARISR